MLNAAWVPAVAGMSGVRGTGAGQRFLTNTVPAE